MIGTLINVVAILAGTALGLLLRKGKDKTQCSVYPVAQ